MSEVELRHILLYEGITAINRVVEQLDFDDVHSTIAILRQHLEERARQTKQREDFSDVLGL